jgi:hypothetical protein
MPRWCPVCQQPSIVGHGRRRKQAHDGQHDWIWVRRSRCPLCKKTFTVLPTWSPQDKHWHMLQNAYVSTASDNGYISPIPNYTNDLTHYTFCSLWSKMLHNAPALLGGRRPTRNPEQVLQQSGSQGDARSAGHRRAVPVGPFEFIPEPVSASSIRIKSFSFSGPTFRNPRAVNDGPCPRCYGSADLRNTSGQPNRQSRKPLPAAVSWSILLRAEQ